jgi:peptide/nickel transport system substrate-binding protein
VFSFWWSAPAMAALLVACSSTKPRVASRLLREKLLSFPVPSPRCGPVAAVSLAPWRGMLVPDDMPRSLFRSLAVISLAVLAAAQTRPRYGGTLRVEIESGTSSLDPSAWPAQLSPLIYDRLVRLDDSGRVQPMLAASWEHDGAMKRWKFHLRAGARFHDGVLVTAAAIAANLKTPYAIRAEGDTLVFESESPAPGLLEQLARSRFGVFHAAADGAVTGTGPFHIAEWQPGRRAVLAANEDY